MEHRPALRRVDLFPGEHRGAVLGQAALLGKLEQQLHRFIRDAVLGIIKINVLERGRQARSPLRVLVKKCAQVLGLDFLEMLFQRFPGGKLGQRRFKGDWGGCWSAHRWILSKKPVRSGSGNRVARSGKRVVASPPFYRRTQLRKP